MPDTPPNASRTQITIAVLGLVGVLGTAVISNWDKVFNTDPSPPPTTSPRASPSARPASPGLPDHPVIRRGAFRNPGSRAHYYDLDDGMQGEEPTRTADFLFKLDDPRNPASKVGVAALNGARLAPGAVGVMPWEVASAEFTASRGISVAQGARVPCLTSERAYATFLVRADVKGTLYVSFLTYR